MRGVRPAAARGLPAMTGQLAGQERACEQLRPGWELRLRATAAAAPQQRSLAPPALSQRFRLALQECGVAVIASAPVCMCACTFRGPVHTPVRFHPGCWCAQAGPATPCPQQVPLGMLLCVCCHVAYRPCRGPTDIKPAGRWIGSKQQSRGERQSSSQSIRRKLRHKEASDTKSNKEASGGAPTTAPRAAGCPPPPPPAARCSCARCRPAPLEGCAWWQRTGMYRR